MGAPYRVNDYRRARSNPDELICIIGKPHVLDAHDWRNPILFGAAVFSHPSDDPHLFERRPVRRVLVPGNWVKEMWRPYWDDAVAVWPVGIDTDHWRPQVSKTTDVLIYDKVQWDHDHYETTLIRPIRETLCAAGRSFQEIRYGYYREEEFHRALGQCRTMIFLCEHETQGIAYQQALASGVPILAWDRGGYWLDPAYFPERVKFAPVSSVPYWDERCGGKFADYATFGEAWGRFWNTSSAGGFAPRDYILENLTLEKSAAHYLRHVETVSDTVGGA